jgi:hypothetical protein
MIPAIVLFFGMMFLPESPRWLATKDRWEECEAVLILTHGKGDPDSPLVAREFREIKQWLEIERQSKSVSYVELFSPRYINRSKLHLYNIMQNRILMVHSPHRPLHPDLVAVDWHECHDVSFYAHVSCRTLALTRSGIT